MHIAVFSCFYHICPYSNRNVPAVQDSSHFLSFLKYLDIKPMVKSAKTHMLFYTGQVILHG